MTTLNPALSDLLMRPDNPNPEAYRDTINKFLAGIPSEYQSAAAPTQSAATPTSSTSASGMTTPLTPELVSKIYTQMIGRVPSASGAAQNAGEYATVEDYVARLKQSPQWTGAEYPGAATGVTTGATDEPYTFDVPKTVYPKAETTSRSGLDPDLIKKMTEMVYPQLEQSLTGYSATIDDLMQQALGIYNTQLDRALKTAIPRAVNILSERGILHGTEAQKILAQIAKEAAMESATKGYETALQAATRKLAMPEMLRSILGGTTVSEATSITTDESAPYKIMAGLIQGLM